MNYSSLLGSLADFSIEQAREDRPVHSHHPIDSAELLHTNRSTALIGNGGGAFFEEQGVVVSNETVRHDMEVAELEAASAQDEILSVLSKKNHTDPSSLDWNNYSKSISNFNKSHKQLLTSILMPILTIAFCVFAVYLVIAWMKRRHANKMNSRSYHHHHHHHRHGAFNEDENLELKSNEN